MAKKKLLVAALVVGLFAALFLYLFVVQVQSEKDEILADQVVVVKASKLIPSGSELTHENTTMSKVPSQFLPPNPLLEKDLQIYLNTAVAVQIEPGAMVLTSDFSIAEVARTLSGKIPLAERAMSVAVDNVSGVSGLLRPGDRVDILGTFSHLGKEGEIKDSQGKKQAGFVTMPLLQNVTLLATGQQISEVLDGQNRQRGYSTVTVSVTVEEAELLTITQTKGKLLFLLRNREDVKTVPVKRQLLSQVLIDLEVMQIERKKRIKIRRPKPIKRPTVIIDK